MADTELPAAHVRVLEAIASLHEQNLPPSAQAVALEAGGELSPVRDIINDLHERGCVDASLRLTEDGRSALGR